MKRIVTRCAFCLALLLCCVAIFAACGPTINPTPTYEALHYYIEEQGGALKYENLKDSTYGKINIDVNADDDSIFFHYSWFVSASFFDNSHFYWLMIAFSRDPNKPVSILYSETSSGTTLLVDAECTDVTKPSYSFEDLYVSKDSNELPGSSREYREAVSAAKTAVKNLQSWISAITSVALGDDSLTVQDLYNPS